MCTLEFEDHRPLYNWFIQQLGIFPSQQIEFDRLNLTYTLLSKRKLLQLVNDGHVSGWNDPRMPTLSGIRRRGYPAQAIRNFVTAVGVSRTNGTVESAMLGQFVREELNRTATRAMAARSNQPSTGSRRGTPSPPKFASTKLYSIKKIPATFPMARISPPI